MNKKNVLIAMGAAVVGGFTVQYGAPFLQSDGSGVPAENSASKSGEPEVLYWAAPMDPNFRRDQPGKSPMGMDLIPVYADAEGGADDAGVVKIKPQTVNNLGVRSTKVIRRQMNREVQTVGYLDFDESRMSHLHVRADGWIEKLAVRSVGEEVKRGDLLFEIYSPALVNAQAEYLQALQTGRKGLIGASEERLRALDFSDQQIKRLERKRKTERLVQVRARQDGIISELNVREGMYIVPGLNVLTLADLSSVWLLADVFESQAQWVSEGQVARMSLPYTPGQSWTGKVEYVYPTLDPKSRTLKVRLRFENPDNALKPNMYASVLIEAESVGNVLTVPREALIRAGRNDRVIVDLGEGRYKPMMVKVGIEANGQVAIGEGLKGDEKVVVSGQFLIDSEASLSASMMRMSDPEGDPASEPAGAGTPTTIKPQAVTMGAINKISDDGKTVNISHDPIPEIGWPSMTMDFKVIGPFSLNGFSSGDSVLLGVAQDADGMYGLVSLEIRSPAKPKVWTRGTVNNVLTGENKVNISHDPIAELGWPSMTMDFSLLESVSESDFVQGQTIEIGLAKDAEGTFAIGAVRPASDKPYGMASDKRAQE